MNYTSSERKCLCNQGTTRNSSETDQCPQQVSKPCSWTIDKRKRRMGKWSNSSSSSRANLCSQWYTFPYIGSWDRKELETYANRCTCPDWYVYSDSTFHFHLLNIMVYSNSWLKVQGHSLARHLEKLQAPSKPLSKQQVKFTPTIDDLQCSTCKASEYCDDRVELLLISTFI